MQQTRSAGYALLGETYQVILDNSNADPTAYEEAFEDVDVEEWKRAMDHEMESMDLNSVWSLVESPIVVKPIGSKLIYKKKSLAKPYVHIRFRYSGSLLYFLHK